MVRSMVPKRCTVIYHERTSGASENFKSSSIKILPSSLGVSAPYYYAISPQFDSGLQMAARFTKFIPSLSVK